MSYFFFLPQARALFLFISATREFGQIKDPTWCDSVMRYRHSKEAWSTRRLPFPAGVKKVNLKWSSGYLLLAFLMRTDGATP
ncbi:TPA: hypothetical protein OMF01_001535 [Klebsiella quasipneumoniae]|nr:hypothetical protein [Klebsiella quasipneumoniae]HCB0616001.1 hypothetical protein [Klebsiella quasipneumoniae subsp. quasipneumoniae]MBR7454385.1 hypothetical protein [Klebsiella quasipneumoniae]MCQ3903467.1 hypothetical protein [Klebsiella quasipneumoniae]QLN96791.1 hypothetical protein HV140_10325 [Klebsiella quasipneumoniae]